MAESGKLARRDAGTAFLETLSSHLRVLDVSGKGLEVALRAVLEIENGTIVGVRDLPALLQIQGAAARVVQLALAYDAARRLGGDGSSRPQVIVNVPRRPAAAAILEARGKR